MIPPRVAAKSMQDKVYINHRADTNDKQYWCIIKTGFGKAKFDNKFKLIYDSQMSCIHYSLILQDYNKIGKYMLDW
jgi:hypothetical protein